MKNLLFLFFLVINCSTNQINTGNFKVFATKEINTENTSEKKVVGEHCRYVNIYNFQETHPRIDLAIQEALKNSPKNSKGLKDIEINLYYASGYTFIGLLFPIYYILAGPMYEFCYIVNGTPAKVIE